MEESQPSVPGKPPQTLVSSALHSSSTPYPFLDRYQTSGNIVKVEYDMPEHRPVGINDVLMKEYRQWAGTPYRYGGEGREGIDCSALMQHIFKAQFNYLLPRTAAEQMTKGRRIARADLKPGDLIFFKPSRRLNHVALYLGNGRFMHASSSQGVMISKLNNTYWARRYVQARRPLEQAQLASRSSEAQAHNLIVKG